MNRNLLNPFWLVRKISLRVSGIEARNLYKELVELKSKKVDHDKQSIEFREALEKAHQDLQVIQHQFTFAREARETRIHSYVAEALSLASAKVQVKQSRAASSKHSDLDGKFSKYGSDKETRHSYAATYAEILAGIENPHILEIGLGSLNGFPYGGLAPGGSIKAWRDAYPTAVIVGADIDEEAVNSISEIGVVVDQTSDESLNIFVSKIGAYSPFDLIVDDGFHDPHANLRTLMKVFPLLSDTGSYVIEDVHNSMIDLWRLLSLTVDGTLEIRDLSADRPETDDNFLLIFTKKRSEA